MNDTATTHFSVVAATRYVGVYRETQVHPTGDGASSSFGFSRHPFGFDGRPNDPEVDASSDPNHAQVINGAHVIYWYEGNTLITFTLDDPRVNATLPQLAKGGVRMYDASGARIEFDGKGNVDATSVASAKFGNSAQALAFGSALKTLIGLLKTFAAGNCVNGSELTTATAFIQALEALTDAQLETQSFEAT